MIEEEEENTKQGLLPKIPKLGLNVVENILGSSQTSGKGSSCHQRIPSALDSVKTKYTATFARDSYTDYFNKATSLLKEIVHLETSNLEAFKAQTLIKK